MTTPVAVVDFTLPIDEFTPEDVIRDLRVLAKKWAFQAEEGEGGYRHYQGRMSLHKKARPGEALKLMRSLDGGVWEKVHLTPSSTNSTQGQCFYVLKAATRIDGPWTDTTYKEAEYIPRQYRGLLERLHPWQQTVIDSRNTFETRLINFVYDPVGNHGKSTLASLAELHFNALDLPPIGDHKELLQVVCDILMAKSQRDPSLVFVDLPRAMDPKRLAPFMIAIEQIKKGHVCDVRHHYKHWWFDSPQIWVFANWLPEMRYLSADRWRLWSITDGLELVRYHPRDPEFMQFE